MNVQLYVGKFLQLAALRNNADIRELFVELQETAAEDYYAKPSGHRRINAPGLVGPYLAANATALPEHQLRYWINDVAKGQLSCGYSVIVGDHCASATYLSSGGNLCWMTWHGSCGLVVGYAGRRHGMNLHRLVGQDIVDVLIKACANDTHEVNLLSYETQEKSWAWWETADNHPIGE